MAHGIGASGVIRPSIKDGAKSDKDLSATVKYVRRLKKCVCEGGGDLEIARPALPLDLANIRTGWLHFANEQAPQRLIDPARGEVAAWPEA